MTPPASQSRRSKNPAFSRRALTGGWRFVTLLGLPLSSCSRRRQWLAARAAAGRIPAGSSSPSPRSASSRCTANCAVVEFACFTPRVPLGRSYCCCLLSMSCLFCSSVGALRCYPPPLLLRCAPLFINQFCASSPRALAWLLRLLVVAVWSQYRRCVVAVMELAAVVFAPDPIW